MSRKLMVSMLVLASSTALMGAVSLGGCGGGEANISLNTGASTTPPPPASTPSAEPTPSAAPSAAPAIKATKNVTLEGHQVKIPGEIEFDSGKATIRETQAGTDVMTALKDFLEQNPGVTKLQIEGHTDNQALKDKAMTNQKLSEERANNVLGWLVAKGIKRDRLVGVGYGDTKPKEKNDTDAHRQANRRTEFHILEIDGKPTGGGSGAAAAAGGAGGTAAAGSASAKPGASAASSAKPAASVPPKK